MSLLGKARARPDQVRKLLDSVSQQGAVATYQKAMNRLDSYTPLGYSLCGVVVEVGAGAEQFSVGQLVAAAGNEFALHAEVNWVPVNLCVPVPAGVAPEHAAFATVGRDRDAGRPPCRGRPGGDGVRHRPRADRPARRPPARRLRRPGGGSRHRRGSVPRRREGRRARLRRPRRRGRGAAGGRAARAHRRPRRRPRAAGGGRRLEPSRRDGGTAGPRPCTHRRHRQDQARPAVERLLRQGARRPVLPVVRPRSLRRPLRAGGRRLPGGLRPLDGAPQPGVLPRPARRGLGRRRLARLGRQPRRRGRRGLRQAGVGRAVGRRVPAVLRAL